MSDTTDDAAQRPIIAENDPRIALGHDRLAAYWDGIGPSDSDLIAYLINPQFQGKPAWPNMRQAYRVVRPVGSLIIASDGLSDPFVNTSMDDCNGFGSEVFIETPDLAGADFDAIRSSWAFGLIENFAMNVADWGGIANQLRRNGVISTEFSGKDLVPAEWLTSDGQAGFLVNIPVPNRANDVPTMPFAPVLIVALTLLRPAEFAYVVKGGAEARKDLAERLSAAGSGHRSSLARASVI